MIINHHITLSKDTSCILEQLIFTKVKIRNKFSVTDFILDKQKHLDLNCLQNFQH